MASSSRHAVLAGFLGWTLDAFDFFVVVFLYDTLAKEFGVSKKLIIGTVAVTLAFRPIGALIFGALADRYGRRIPLMANVIYFSIIELLCGFSTSYTQFIILRALFGIGMGGEWGVGASLAMEGAPRKWRGVLSGILQSGYSNGYLLAAVASRWISPAHWRWMFWLGALPALLALYIRTKVPESEAWREHRVGSMREMFGAVRAHAKGFSYLVLLMTFMMFLSHGTQDLYPDFLKELHHFTQATASNVAIIFNIGAVIGAIIFGQLSQRVGRRYSMIAALALSLLVIPLWAFGGTLVVLTIGAFLMQMGVQGAWGIIPVHLNELAPDAVRGLMPGLAYQLGILIASPVNSIQHGLRDRVGYSWALAGFEIFVMVVLTVVLLFGREEHGRAFRSSELLIEKE
jgi:SHS family lactate transporter-like MFS transporter